MKNRNRTAFQAVSNVNLETYLHKIESKKSKTNKKAYQEAKKLSCGKKSTSHQKHKNLNLRWFARDLTEQVSQNSPDRTENKRNDALADSFFFFFLHYRKFQTYKKVERMETPTHISLGINNDQLMANLVSYIYQSHPPVD